MFEESKGEEFVYVREHLKLSLEVISQWDPWGICQICGRAKDDGLRKKRGYCRIKLTANSDEKGAIGAADKRKPDEQYLLHVNAVSCRSLRLGSVLPGQWSFSFIIYFIKLLSLHYIYTILKIVTEVFLYIQCVS